MLLLPLVIGMAFEREIYDGGTVCTVGMFDGVHRGHQLILRRLREVAAERGLRPVVVTFDRHPRVVLGHTDGGFRLLTTGRERTGLFARYGMCHIGDVETVQFTPEVARMSACEFYERELRDGLNVKVLLLGYDNMFGNKRRNDFEQLMEMPGLEVVRTEALVYDGVEISSTQIRNRLALGDIAGANAMLGHCYSVSGRVVHGKGIGRTIQFPTANVEVDDPMKAMPKAGVYAVRVSIDAEELCGIANWGGRPTVGATEPTLEVHVIDYDGDLYGRQVTVWFVERLRDVVAFDSLEALSRQLKADRDVAMGLLRI